MPFLSLNSFTSRLILEGESWAKLGIERVTTKSNVIKKRNNRVIRSSIVIGELIGSRRPLSVRCSYYDKLTTGIIGFKISDELLYVGIAKIIEYHIQENYMNATSINERI